MNEKEKELILHEVKSLAQIHSFVKCHEVKGSLRENDITISDLKDTVIRRAFVLIDTIIEKGGLDGE